ncbi:MAG: hypothetical protein KDJ34_04500 [Candidatus Competibacteraceae bacterium]|nr:hypothetical protein [Candidatus Competibacteraceae bacterium]
MKLLGQLTDDRFHEAAGARELLDDPGGRESVMFARNGVCKSMPTVASSA